LHDLLAALKDVTTKCPWIDSTTPHLCRHTYLSAKFILVELSCQIENGFHNCVMRMACWLLGGVTDHQFISFLLFTARQNKNK